MAKWGSNKCGTPLRMILLVAVVAAAVNAQPGAQPLDCVFPNASRVSPTACSHNDSRTVAARMLACLPFLDEDEADPSAKCCAGVRNASVVSPACLCKHVFFFRSHGAPDAAAVVNRTRGKLVPRLCNVTSDLCRDCSAFLVAGSAWPPHHSPMAPSEDGVSLQQKKKTVVGLAVALGVAMACIVVATAVFIRTKLKRRKAMPSGGMESEFQSKQPGSDY